VPIGGPRGIFDRCPVKKSKATGFGHAEDRSSGRTSRRPSREIDEKLVDNIVYVKKTRLYEIDDIRKELVGIDIDPEELAAMPTDDRDIINIKQEVKIYFDKEEMAPFSKVTFGPVSSLFYYKIGRVLGRGSFGKVNLAYHKLTRKLCAVKSINMSRDNPTALVEKLANEIHILRYLRHPAIIKLFESCPVSADKIPDYAKKSNPKL
jgi:serine/threonine protein kinase